MNKIWLLFLFICLICVCGCKKEKHWSNKEWAEFSTWAENYKKALSPPNVPSVPPYSPPTITHFIPPGPPSLTPERAEEAEKLINDYFPTGIGTRWVYEITIGETEPLRQQTNYWTENNGQTLVQLVKGRFSTLVGSNNKPPKTFRLIIKIKKKTAADLESSSENVELAIEEDELGIFKHGKKVSWRQTSYLGAIVIEEIVVYSPKNFGLFDIKQDGYSSHPIFLASNVRIGYSEEIYILFIGIEASRLHLRRTVNAADSRPGRPPDYLDKAFIEDMWFEKGKGLVRLEQRIDGLVSMTWRLVDFSN
ncbi:MAG: hypothetical protein AB1465_05215 [Patescibacteria group bacterium]